MNNNYYKLNESYLNLLCVALAAVRGGERCRVGGTRWAISPHGCDAAGPTRDRALGLHSAGHANRRGRLGTHSQVRVRIRVAAVSYLVLVVFRTDRKGFLSQLQRDALWSDPADVAGLTMSVRGPLLYLFGSPLKLR